jgi:arylsulfatase A-like enzyme
LNTLDSLGLTNNTLVLLTSDNGAVVNDGYRDESVERLGNHRPNGNLRGGKGGVFEGGTRVPLLVRWPGRVRPGTSDALISQINLLASFATLTGQPVNQLDSPDSQNTLRALLGQQKRGRAWLIEQGVLEAGQPGLAITDSPWKYIEPNPTAPRRSEPTNTEFGYAPEPQLYHLHTDPGETINLATRHPEHTRLFQQQIERIRNTVHPKP